jgi:hypothetical protein
LPGAISGYLSEIRLTKKPRTLAAYALPLEYFGRYCVKPNVSDVERSDLLAYAGALRDVEEPAPRTVHNHFANVISFLNWLGILKALASRETVDPDTLLAPQVHTELGYPCAEGRN